MPPKEVRLRVAIYLFPNGSTVPDLISGTNQWEEMIRVYAEHLLSTKRYQLCALYYLTLGEVSSAIDALASGALFLDAISLARLRLGERYAKVRREWSVFSRPLKVQREW